MSCTSHESFKSTSEHPVASGASEPDRLSQRQAEIPLLLQKDIARRVWAWTQRECEDGGEDQYLELCERMSLSSKSTDLSRRKSMPAKPGCLKVTTDGRQASVHIPQLRRAATFSANPVTSTAAVVELSDTGSDDVSPTHIQHSSNAFNPAVFGEQPMAGYAMMNLYTALPAPGAQASPLRHSWSPQTAYSNGAMALHHPPSAMLQDDAHLLLNVVNRGLIPAENLRADQCQQVLAAHQQSVQPYGLQQQHRPSHSPYSTPAPPPHWQPYGKGKSSAPIYAQGDRNSRLVPLKQHDLAASSTYLRQNPPNTSARYEGPVGHHSHRIPAHHLDIARERRAAEWHHENALSRENFLIAREQEDLRFASLVDHHRMKQGREMQEAARQRADARELEEQNRPALGLNTWQRAISRMQAQATGVGEQSPHVIKGPYGLDYETEASKQAREGIAPAAVDATNPKKGGAGPPVKNSRVPSMYLHSKPSSARDGKAPGAIHRGHRLTKK